MTSTLDRDDPATGAGPRRRGRVWLIVAAALIVVILLAWLVAFSPVLGASKIVVRGNHTLSAAQIRSAASIRSGAPLVRLDTSAAARRVEALPDVASAEVSVSYPNSVTITVVERVAVGYLDQGTGALLVDHTGHQFRAVATPPAGLPRFDVPAGQPGVVVGQAVATAAGALSPQVLAQLSAIRASEPDAITLVLRDGRTVFWGDATRSADKARLLPTLLAQPGSYYDVSNPDLVYTR